MLNRNELFKLLKERVVQKKYDDEYLTLLINYQKFSSNEVNFAIFYAAYALFYKNYAVAKEYALKALVKRRINRLLWEILAECYLQEGNIIKSAYYQGLLKKHYGKEPKLAMTDENYQQVLNALSLGEGIGLYAPIVNRRVMYKEGKFFIQQDLFWAEFIPRVQADNSYDYYVGVKLGKRIGDNSAQYVFDKLRYDKKFTDECNADFVFDCMRSQKTNNLNIEVGDKSVIIPLATTVANQVIDFKDVFNHDTAQIKGRQSFGFYRFTSNASISSEQAMIVGKPIKLGHSKQRKKVVLNILVDALCWERIKEEEYKVIPNIMKFFKKGMIFDNHYSVSEYTFPSLATIDTGLYPATSQVFNENTYLELPLNIKTVSEQMNDLGYYCVNVMGDACGIYNGVTRGYERIITTPYAMDSERAVEYTIDQLEAFKECDQFIFLHVDDVHPWSAKDYQQSMKTQTELAWNDRIPKSGEKETSVHLRGGLKYYTHEVEYKMRKLDRILGMLFDYIEANYNDDEYIVQLYSDHGTGVFNTERRYILNDYQTHAALMLRGSGIPQRGIIHDEMTSSIDMYAIMQHIIGFKTFQNHEGNLPQAFGGEKRKYVASYIIFPGQKFQLCIRSEEYQFCLASTTPLLNDGTVDLTGAEVSVFKRGEKITTKPTDEIKQFFEPIMLKLVNNINNHGDIWDEDEKG